AVLRAVTVPPWGGDTLWADTAYAYAQLPADLRALADTLWTVHTNILDQSWTATVQRNEKHARFQQVFTRIKYEAIHPTVRVHPETGERTLLLCSFAKRSAQLSATALADLYLRLQSYITVPENTVRWRWAPGDVAFWDNRATQHYALYDYGDQPRHMQRVTIAGDVPVSVDGRRSEALCGDDRVFNGDVRVPTD
ncbi:MAG: TauD/TfdA dioxygenase family protein, partial [Pseudonocardiaceae bacterium]